MEAAQLQANELARPWGHLGPTPAQAWQSRKPISDNERNRFGRAVRACVHELEEQRGAAGGQRQLQREALARALIRDGLLVYTSASVFHPYPPRRRCKRPNSTP